MFVCLSRACLGKAITFSLKWRQKRSRSNPQGCQSATARPPTESCSAISHPARRYRKRLRWRRPVRKRRHSFLSFPYVCPEPVLVKRSFVSIKWSKRGVFLPSRGRTLSHRSAQHRSIPTGKSDRCWVHFQNHRFMATAYSQ